MSFEQYVQTHRDQYLRSVSRVYSIGIRLSTLYPGNSMNMTHFVFDINTMIQRIHACGIQVRVSYVMSLHKIGPRNNNN